MKFKEEKRDYLSEIFDGSDFSELVISAKEFDDCTFRNCDFSKTTFKRCHFADCEFIQCNLSVASIEYSQFSDVTFHDSKLIGINWTKVSWPQLIMSSPVKFYKCILNDSSFFGLELQEIVIEACMAKNVDFRDGNFSQANFTNTDFSGSLFGKTNLTGADFSEATNYDINVTRNNIKQAKFSRFEALRLLENLEIELID